MADRIAALQAEIESLHATYQATPGPAIPEQPPAFSKFKRKPKHTPPANNPADEPTEEGAVLARLKLELAEALRAKGVSEVRLRAALEDVDRLQGRTRADAERIRVLEGENSALTRKLKDRDHELREKRKLLEVRN